MNHKAEVVNDEQPRNVPAGTTASEGFGTTSLTRVAETSSSALAEQARAQINARYVMALQRPRSWMKVRESILEACRRPGFAAMARYRKPIGQGVEGPSIRFAEEFIRAMTNVVPENAAIFDDDQKRIIRVTVTDLEGNVTYAQDVIIEKTVERNNLRQGQVPIATRANSFGKRVYIVAANDDDLLNKQNALVSKALRTLALRHCPADIMEEAMSMVIATQKNEDAKDPNAARKRMVDAYAAIGVKIDGLVEYLGHAIDTVTADEMLELRALGLAIKEGEATWAEALTQKNKSRDGGGDGATPAVLKDRLKAQAEKTKKGAEAKTEAVKAAPAESAVAEPAGREPGEEA